MNWLKSTYRWVVDHLTKVIAAAGASFMSLVAFIDPAVVKEEAQNYLGDRWVAKIGIALFILAFIRGMYTGYKGKQVKAALDTAQAALPPVQITPVEPQAPIKPAGVG